IAKLNIEDILAIQQLYGIKNSKPTTTTQPPTTEIITNKPTYVDLCTLQYVDTVLLLEQKHVILSLLQYDENNRGIRQTPSPLYVGNLTLRFGRINNLPILRLETSTARLSMSKSTILNIFNLEYCVNRLISSLTTMIDNVDKKFSRLLTIASTVTKSTNMLKTMYDDESFDRNNILDCELITLVFGEH
ncbi:hypothetical protein ALC57_10386, partial [Trachymyrmex cornetzi]